MLKDRLTDPVLTGDPASHLAVQLAVSCGEHGDGLSKGSSAVNTASYIRGICCSCFATVGCVARKVGTHSVLAVIGGCWLGVRRPGESPLARGSDAGSGVVEELQQRRQTGRPQHDTAHLHPLRGNKPLPRVD